MSGRGSIEQTEIHRMLSEYFDIPVTQTFDMDLTPVTTGCKVPYMNSDLALAIATSAHQGQVDKSGVDYIHHPVRVAAGFAQDSDESVVALLHDVLEDTDVSLDDLFAQGLTQAQADALVAITHLDHEPNVDYIARVKGNALATRVKLADLDDNSSPERMANLDQATQDRLQGKYDRARAQLLA